MNRKIILPTLGFAMLAATAFAQTASPPPSAPATAPATTAAPKAPETNLAGQGKWRASKLMGVDIYGPDNSKVGDVTEVIMGKDGKVEMITVGVGGFLGIGAKDVAIPYEQVTWSDQPMAASAAPATTGTGSMGGGTAPAANAPASAPAPAAAPKAPAMYPDHGKITMTKDQLKDAPAVTYSGT